MLIKQEALGSSKILKDYGNKVNYHVHKIPLFFFSLKNQINQFQILSSYSSNINFNILFSSMTIQIFEVVSFLQVSQSKLRMYFYCLKYLLHDASISLSLLLSPQYLSEERKSCSSSLCSFIQSPTNFSIFGLGIYVCTTPTYLSVHNYRPHEELSNLLGALPFLISQHCQLY